MVLGACSSFHTNLPVRSGDVAYLQKLYTFPATKRMKITSIDIKYGQTSTKIVLIERKHLREPHRLTNLISGICITIPSGVHQELPQLQGCCRQQMAR